MNKRERRIKSWELYRKRRRPMTLSELCGLRKEYSIAAMYVPFSKGRSRTYYIEMWYINMLLGNKRMQKEAARRAAKKARKVAHPLSYGGFKWVPPEPRVLPVARKIRPMVDFHMVAVPDPLLKTVLVPELDIGSPEQISEATGISKELIEETMLPHSDEEKKNEQTGTAE